MLPDTKIILQFCEVLRTREEHETHCVELDEESSVKYDINWRSILIYLKHFDNCNGGLLPDVMHNVLEGLLQYETKLYPEALH